MLFLVPGDGQSKVHGESMYELEVWGEFSVRALEGLGYERRSPIARFMEEGYRPSPQFRSKLPRGVVTSGLSEYLLVEKALNSLGSGYRDAAIVEYIIPTSVTGRTKLQRAVYMGVSISAYNRRLKRIKEEILILYDNEYFL